MTIRADLGERTNPDFEVRPMWDINPLGDAERKPRPTYNRKRKQWTWVRALLNSNLSTATLDSEQL